MKFRKYEKKITKSLLFFYNLVRDTSLALFKLFRTIARAMAKAVVKY